MISEEERIEVENLIKEILSNKYEFDFFEDFVRIYPSKIDGIYCLDINHESYDCDIDIFEVAGGDIEKDFQQSVKFDWIFQDGNHEDIKKELKSFLLFLEL